MGVRADAVEKKKIIEEEIFAWDQQPGESVIAFRAFQAYLELGPMRLVREVADVISRNTSIIAKWATRHQWIDRASKHDLHKERVFQAELDGAVLEMRIRHKRLGAEMQRIGLDALDDADTIAARDAATIVKTGHDIERLAIDAPTTIDKKVIDATVKTEETLPPEVLEKIGALLVVEEEEGV